MSYKEIKTKAISIHAPARGATYCGATMTGFVKISIHAPARGATASGLSSMSASGNFNPRSRKGSDEEVFS